MNILAKRSLSLLTALVLIVGLFSGVALPASAASYSYNWGTRGVTATYLSSAAQNFYANNGTSYEELSSYAGSATLSAVPGSEMYSQLQTLMKNNHSYETSYAATRDMYQYTDCQGGGGAISSFYSGTAIGPAWDSGSTWNREHTWPNSKGLAGADENDIMMLRPTAKSENGSRGNTAYGISSGYYDPNMESGYTLNLHGDVARIFLYVYVRWGNVNGNGQYSTWGTSGVMESREVLLAWMEEDPVDTWELGRNDVVQEITGTRNVFVDYPELAFLMFGEEIPDTMPTPSGMAIAGAYDVAVTTNDAAMGSAYRSGKDIVALPAEGYRAVGYEVVSGTAEVTQNGNVFEVKASSDCEIRIIFEAKPIVALTYLDNGTVLSSSEVYDGDPILLSSYTGTAPAAYSFLGWVDAAVSDTETAPTYYKAGSSYTVNGAITLQALFSRVIKGAQSATTVYTTSPCVHTNTVEKTEIDADCMDIGYAAGTYCNDCAGYISGGEIISAYGHSYTGIVTPPTVTEDGYTTYTCGRCGDSYTGDPVPALGETYTVSFSVPVDAATIENMGCNTTGIILPEAESLEGYTFLGWTDASVSDTMEKPVVLSAGEKYVATADTSLHALYTYTVGGSAEGGFVLADSADDLKAGAKVVIASSAHDYALSTTQNSNNRGQAAITKSGNTITFDASAGVAVLELQEGTVAGTYAFYCPTNGGYLYAASGSSNYLRTQSALDANGSFLIEIGEGGVCTVNAQGANARNSLRYNTSAKLFSCYASTNTSTALVKVSLYVETPAGDVYYTTDIAHRHSGTYHAAVEATCAQAGNVEYWSCACGQNFSDSGCTTVIADVTLPQPEHSFTAETVDAKYLKSEANCQSGAVYYLSCAGCGASSASDKAVFGYGSVNSANHPGEGIFTGELPATCTENGTSGDTVCGGCGAVMTAGTVYPATGHADAIAVAETVSTCKTHGVKFHFHCDTCGGDYLEKGVNAVAQTTEDLQLALNPLNHEGETELRNESDATCEADGYTGDTHCSGCGEKLYGGEVIPGGHSIKEVSAAEPTFEADGNIAHFACETCGKLFADAEGNTQLAPEDVLLEKLTGVAAINGIPYETLAEALKAAKAGETVQLLQSTAEETVTVRGNVMLDLNGHTLTAEYVFAVKGSHIVDNSESNTGLLVVNPDLMMVSSGNAHLPIWNGEGYIFVEILKLNELTDGNSYIFQPFFETVAHEYLAKGAAFSGVKIAVRMTWTVPTGTAYQDFVYNDGSVADFVNSYNAEIGKYGLALNVNIYTSIPSFTKQVILISDTGVELVCN